MSDDTNNDVNVSLSSISDGDNQYKVGYGKPPKNGQFKPGQSGNPKGKKKKSSSVAQQIKSALSKKVEVREGGKTRRLTLQQVMFKTITNNAAKGDLKAAEFLLKHKNSIEADTTEFIDQVQTDAEDQAIIDTYINQMAFGEEIVETEPSDGQAELTEQETKNPSKPVQTEPENTHEKTISDVADKTEVETDDGYQEEDDAPPPPPAPEEPVEAPRPITSPNSQSLCASATPKLCEQPMSSPAAKPIGQPVPSIELVNKPDIKVTVVRSARISLREKAKHIDAATDASESDEW